MAVHTYVPGAAEAAAACGLSTAEYLAEVEECRQADIRMAKIDKRNAAREAKREANLTPEQRYHRAWQARRTKLLQARNFNKQGIGAVGSIPWITAMLESDMYEEIEYQALRKTALFQNLAEKLERVRADINARGLPSIFPKKMGRPKGSKNKAKTSTSPAAK